MFIYVEYFSNVLQEKDITCPSCSKSMEEVYKGHTSKLFEMSIVLIQFIIDNNIKEKGFQVLDNLVKDNEHFQGNFYYDSRI